MAKGPKIVQKGPLMPDLACLETPFNFNTLSKFHYAASLYAIYQISAMPVLVLEGIRLIMVFRKTQT